MLTSVQSSVKQCSVRVWVVYFLLEQMYGVILSRNHLVLEGYCISAIHTFCLQKKKISCSPAELANWQLTLTEKREQDTVWQSESEADGTDNGDGGDNSADVTITPVILAPARTEIRCYSKA